MWVSKISTKIQIDQLKQVIIAIAHDLYASLRITSPTEVLFFNISKEKLPDADNQVAVEFMWKILRSNEKEHTQQPPTKKKLANGHEYSFSRSYYKDLSVIDGLQSTPLYMLQQFLEEMQDTEIKKIAISKELLLTATRIDTPELPQDEKIKANFGSKIGKQI